jgi:hypothetical protein
VNPPARRQPEYVADPGSTDATAPYGSRRSERSEALPGLLSGSFGRTSGHTAHLGTHLPLPRRCLRAYMGVLEGDAR